MSVRSSVAAGKINGQRSSPFAIERGNKSDDINNVGEERLHLTIESDSGDVSMSAATERFPPGELERLESRRALRTSQANVIARRRKSFIAEFSEMKGPPQIAMVMALLAMGLGATIGVVPAVMSDRFARLNHGYAGDASCDEFAAAASGEEDLQRPGECFLGSSDAQAAASVSNLISNSLTFLTASMVGSLSDEYGRKGMLMFGLVLSMIPSFCLYLTLHIPTMNPWWYYSSSAATGFVSWMAIALSALNDVLPKEFRAPGIGLLFAGFMLGISLSPTLGLFFKRKTLCLISFLVVAIGFLLTVAFVPETLKAEVAQEAKRRRLQREQDQLDRERESRMEAERRARRGSFPSYLLRGFYYGPFCRTMRLVFVKPFVEMSILNRNCFFRLISALAFFTGMVNSADQVLLIYYLEDHLRFGQGDISLMFMIIGVTGILVQVFVMKPLNDLVGEKMVVAISFMCGAINNAMYGIAHHKSTVFVALTISGFTNMSFPTISAIKANNVRETEQGRIQGALYSVKALASGVGPALLQFVYSKTKDGLSRWSVFGPGTMFVFAAGLFLVAVGLALALPSDKANTSRRHGGGGNSGDTDSDSFDEPSGIVAIGDDEIAEYHALVSDSSDEEDYGTI